MTTFYRKNVPPLHNVKRGKGCSAQVKGKKVGETCRGKKKEGNRYRKKS